MQIYSYLRLFICVVLWFKSYLLNTFVFSAEQRNAKSTPAFSGNFCRWKQKIELRSSQSTAPKPVFLIFALYFALKARKNLSCLGRQKRFLLWWTGMDSNHRSLWQRIYSPLPLAAREPVHISCKLVELVMGLEPATCWLQISCSANWATPALGCIGNAFLLKKMAIRRGLEPLTSSVTGWHSNQLNYRTAVYALVGLQGLEPRTNRLWADRSNQLS